MLTAAKAMDKARQQYRSYDANRDQMIRGQRVRRLTGMGLPAEVVGESVGMTRGGVTKLLGKPPIEMRQRMDFTVTPRRGAEVAQLADSAVAYAMQLRDEDPQLVWNALALLDRYTLQALAVVALAGLPVDQPASKLWRWVEDLVPAEDGDS